MVSEISEAQERSSVLNARRCSRHACNNVPDNSLLTPASGPTYGNVLRFNGSKEVLHDWICVIAKRDLDWALEAMDVTIIAGTLVCST